MQAVTANNPDMVFVTSTPASGLGEGQSIVTWESQGSVVIEKVGHPLTRCNAEPIEPDGACLSVREKHLKHPQYTVARGLF